MSAHTYDEARFDFEYLESLAELGDWITIADELVDLMRDPTKKRAAQMYIAAITLWHAEHRGFYDERAERIKLRYGA